MKVPVSAKTPFVNCLIVTEDANHTTQTLVSEKVTAVEFLL